ncbi:MAG: isoprenylcysteine carboxylmethyltransferase family protein [Chloroflexi bacterium]|nr:isoprenylcysteine carboxylmethyltransferase family protein [Chloroflexota bacterium]
MPAVFGTVIFTILVPGSVTVLVPYLLLTSGLEWTYDIGNSRFIGLALIALGAALYFWTAWDFAFAGKGTPAPIAPPKSLVSRRLYQVNRNPMYTGVLLVLLGEAIFFMSLTLLAYTAFLWLASHLFVVYYEEPNLRKKFGATYGEYCKVVPRWIPRVERASKNR